MSRDVLVESFRRASIAQLARSMAVLAPTTEVTIAANGGRTLGAPGLKITPSSTACGVLWSSSATFTGTGYAGFWVKCMSLGDQIVLGVVGQGSQPDVSFGVNASGQLVAGLITGGGAYVPLFTDTVQRFWRGSWAFVEIEFKLASTGGIFNGFVNGVAAGTFSGNTKKGTVAGCDSIGLGTNMVDSFGVSAGAGMFGAHRYYSDLYFDPGAARGGRWGKMFTRDLFPTGTGSNTGLTPAAGTDFGSVSERGTQDDDTTYIQSATLNATTTLDMANVPIMAATPTILAVRPYAIAKVDFPGDRSVANAIRSGGTVYLGTSEPMTTEYMGVHEAYTQDPATSANWTEAGVNALEVGVKVTV
jgi:hypothetical protein